MDRTDRARGGIRLIARPLAALFSLSSSSSSLLSPPLSLSLSLSLSLYRSSLSAASGEFLRQSNDFQFGRKGEKDPPPSFSLSLSFSLSPRAVVRFATAESSRRLVAL